MQAIAGISFQETQQGMVVHVRKNPKRASAGKLRKKLPYHFKLLSKQIRQAKTAEASRPLVTKLQAKLSWLYKKLRSGEYGDSEVMAAILHAAAMEQIAKKKVRHLEAEEAAENKNGAGNPFEEGEDSVGNVEESNGENVNDEGKVFYGEDELQESLAQKEAVSEEMMQRMMEEIDALEEELAKDSMSEWKDMISCAGKNLSEEELEELKRKHRAQEERQLTRADLNYLKALFDRLEQEKKQNTPGGGHFESNSGATFSYAIDGAFSGDVMTMTSGEMDVGECVDVSV